ncbi:MAG: hypothetical protein HQK96_01740 [Nitrospirae bacterium]|nr:hypothetical protein [Nitrospirota bacterium]
MRKDEDTEQSAYLKELDEVRWDYLREADSYKEDWTLLLDLYREKLRGEILEQNEEGIDELEITDIHGCIELKVSQRDVFINNITVEDIYYFHDGEIRNSVDDYWHHRLCMSLRYGVNVIANPKLTHDDISKMPYRIQEKLEKPTDCKCNLSKRMPHCDGSHKGPDKKPEMETYYIRYIFYTFDEEFSVCRSIFSNNVYEYLPFTACSVNLTLQIDLLVERFRKFVKDEIELLTTKSHSHVNERFLSRWSRPNYSNFDVLRECLRLYLLHKREKVNFKQYEMMSDQDAKRYPYVAERTFYDNISKAEKILHEINETGNFEVPKKVKKSGNEEVVVLKTLDVSVPKTAETKKKLTKEEQAAIDDMKAVLRFHSVTKKAGITYEDYVLRSRIDPVRFPFYCDEQTYDDLIAAAEKINTEIIQIIVTRCNRAFESMDIDDKEVVPESFEEILLKIIRQANNREIPE